MRLRFLAVLLGILGLFSCQREWLDPKDLHITASPGIQLPLAHVQLDMEDILPLDSTPP